MNTVWKYRDTLQIVFVISALELIETSVKGAPIKLSSTVIGESDDTQVSGQTNDASDRNQCTDSQPDVEPN